MLPPPPFLACITYVLPWQYIHLHFHAYMRFFFFLHSHVWKTRKKIFAREFYYCSQEKKHGSISSAELLIINSSLMSLTLMMPGLTLTLTVTVEVTVTFMEGLTPVVLCGQLDCPSSLCL